MKKKILLQFIVFGLMFSNCQNDAVYEFKEIDCMESGMVSNTTIQTVKEMFTFGGPVLIEEDLIIEGYVVSSDKAGNFYKSLSIQDKSENPTAAISVSVDATNLYTKYEVGRKVFVKLKGLAIGNHFGRVQIGQIFNGALQGVSPFEYKEHLFKSCELAELVPYEVSLIDVDKQYLDMFVSLSNTQFSSSEIGKSFAETTSGKSVDRLLEEYNSECEKTGELNIRTSGFADFKNYSLPEGKGMLSAVLQNYYSDLQLVLRDEDDISFEQERCIDKMWDPNLSISDVVALNNGEVVELNRSEEMIIEGFVISSDQEGNFQDRIVIQDKIQNPSAGIQILIDKESLFESFGVGERVLVKLNSLYLGLYHGNLSLGIHKNGNVAPLEENDIEDCLFGTKEFYELIPESISMNDLPKAIEQTLIKVDEVQLDSTEIGKAYAYYSGPNDGLRTLVNCESFQKIQVYTSGDAVFASERFPMNKGSIIGVFGKYLEMRSRDDVLFEKSYEYCLPRKPPILISEVADPVNNVGARFVELFNSGDVAFSLDGWKLEKFVNGSENVSSGSVDLSGIVIESNSYIVIGNSEFETIFGIAPTIMSSYISGNGDDVYRLVDSGRKTIDIYGVIGEDGNGKNWEYLDGGAVRNKQVKIPSEKFDFNEWIVSTKAKNFMVDYPNTPKYAPIDYLPFSE